MRTINRGALGAAVGLIQEVKAGEGLEAVGPQQDCDPTERRPIAARLSVADLGDYWRMIAITVKSIFDA